jgi:Tol biopolymer transport system component
MVLVNILAGAAYGQTYYFGQNKVHYKDFDWAVFRTEHFDVYYYAEEEEAAHDAARMAERGYTYLSEIFEYQFKNRIPLILYASLNDFQQTNVVGEIGRGTRGVTESAKGRVVLPITGSYREFNHVLVHELVHAFQFDIMLNPKNIDPDARGLNPALWFVEGMAEYLSVGMDNITRMWVRDGLEYGNLLTVDKLNATFDIRVYRLGESLWNYIGETYGKKKVGQILKTAVQFGNIERAFKLQLDMDNKQLTEAWHKAMRETVLAKNTRLQKPDAIATKLTKKESLFHRMNVVPAISPDGKKIAYVTDKNLVDDIYIVEEKSQNDFEARRLIKGSQSTDFEALRFFETTINWSRDGEKVAFISKSGKDDALYVTRARDGKPLYRFVFDELNGLLSPSFSPDGKEVVFAGISGGRSDLYIVNLNSGKHRRLTQDRFATFHPQWSPDGKSIAFITDRGPGTDENELLFGDYDLALYDLESGKIELITELNGNVTSPQWSKDATGIAFVSEHQGIPNIYKINLETRDVLPVTFLQAGVAGITNLTPAMSWSADGRYMAFSTFENGAWQIYRLEMPSEDYTYHVMRNDRNVMATMQPEIKVASGTYLAPMDSTKKAGNDSTWVPGIPEQNFIYANYRLADSDSIETRNYSNRISFDGGALGGSFGGFLGTTASAAFQFSDMLGNHRLITSVGLRFDLWNSDLSFAYLNQANRINFGVEAFQVRNAFGAFASFNQLGFIRQTYRGFNAFALYPFSRFARFEVGAGITRVSQDFVIDTFSGNDRDRETTDIGGFTFGQLNTALVFDNTGYGFIGPMSGSRSRFSVQRAMKDFSFTTYLADYRKYVNVKNRSALAYRFLGGKSTGQDAQFFRIGGPFTFRGANYGELIGTDFLVSNLEYRFPLLPFLPANYDFLRATLFFDAAAAWGGADIPGLVKSTFQPFSTDGGFRLNDLQAAYGFGFRFNLGAISLKYDIAFPTDFKDIDKPITFFSIGTDF